MAHAWLIPTTKVLHWSWTLLVLSSLFAADSFSLLSPIVMFSTSDTLFGWTLGFAFSITPILTLLSLHKRIRPLFHYALICNTLSVVHGISGILKDAYAGNDMIALVIFSAFLTIGASFCGIYGVHSIMRNKNNLDAAI